MLVVYAMFAVAADTPPRHALIYATLSHLECYVAYAYNSFIIYQAV